ncbi:MAG: ABC1 kinase family protein [Planctomycetota bacterium]
MLRSIRTIRNIPRLKDITFILFKHGLHQVASRLGAPVFVRLRGLVRGRGAPSREPPLSQIARLRLAFQELGPIYIKLGQLIANRPDVFPPAMVTEFAKLEDHVAPLKFETINAVLEEELGAPTERFFRHVNPEPLAAASIAQVHRAVTLSGEDVILKIQKPGIRKIMEHDLEILELVAEALSNIEGIGVWDPKGIVAEVSRALERELDFNFERNALDRVRAQFADDPVVVVPRTFREHSTEKLLVLEFLDGTPIRQLDPAALGPAECHRIARECSRTLFEMIFRDGYFHADPHSSNILRLTDGRLGWIDFGAVGLFTDEMRLRLVKLLRALLERNYRLLARQVLKVGRPQGEISMFEFSQDLASRLDPYFGLSLKETDIPTLFTTVMDIARDYRIRISPGFVTMTRCLVLMEGLAHRLAPDFDAVVELEPLARRYFTERYRPDRLVKDAGEQLAELARTFWEYPQLVGEILHRAAEGRIAVDTEIQGLERFQRAMELSTNRIVAALVVSSLLVSSSLIINSKVGPEVWGVSAVGLTGYVFAGLISVRILISMLRSN